MHYQSADNSKFKGTEEFEEFESVYEEIFLYIKIVTDGLFLYTMSSLQRTFTCTSKNS